MAFTQVDLRGLPFPSVVEALSFEEILSNLKAVAVQSMPAIGPVLALESEPATKVLEVCAAYIMLTRQRVNDAAKAVMLPYATGADLENLAALFGVVRLMIEPATETTAAVYEDDDSLRLRVQLALEGMSTAGPRGSYLFHALSADADVLDVSVSGPMSEGIVVPPGQVTIGVVSRSNNGVASAALLAAVHLAVNDERVRPLTDTVVVVAAAPIDVAVSARLILQPDAVADVVVTNARAALDAYLASRRRAGGVVAVSGIYAALQKPGVIRVDLLSPTADVVASPVQFPRAGAISITATQL